MKILVAIKQVVNLDDEFEIREDQLGIDEDYCEYEINEWDDFSVEEAILIKERNNNEGEIVVVSIGPERVEDELRRCLGKGADRAVRIWDEAIENSDQVAIGRIIAKAVEMENPDMVFIGVQSADHAFSITGVTVARILNWPHAAVVSHLDYKAGDRQATVHRELEGGLEERLIINCPAVLTIQLGINEPRYSSFRAIKQAKTKPLDVITHRELGLTDSDVGVAGSASLIRRIYIPEKPRAQLIRGSTSEQGRRLAEIIDGLRGGQQWQIS